jgi:hypothetical protein
MTACKVSRSSSFARDVGDFVLKRADWIVRLPARRRRRRQLARRHPLSCAGADLLSIDSTADLACNGTWVTLRRHTSITLSRSTRAAGSCPSRQGETTRLSSAFAAARGMDFLGPARAAFAGGDRRRILALGACRVNARRLPPVVMLPPPPHTRDRGSHGIIATAGPRAQVSGASSSPPAPSRTAQPS